MYKDNVTVQYLEGKCYVQYANMKEIANVQNMEVCFPLTNTLYSVILSVSQLHLDILNLKLNVGSRGRSTIL